MMTRVRRLGERGRIDGAEMGSRIERGGGGALDDRAGQFFLFRLATQLIVRVHNKADPIGCTWAARGVCCVLITR